MISLTVFPHEGIYASTCPKYHLLRLYRIWYMILQFCHSAFIHVHLYILTAFMLITIENVQFIESH